jgi:glucokinase
VAVIVGVDIGGTKMLAGLVTIAGEPLVTHQTPTRVGSYMEDLTHLVSTMVQVAAERGERVAGIGVGTTGLVDHAGGRMRRSLTLGIRDFPIRSALEDAFGVPAFIDNDIHAAALGELMFGVGRKYRDFLLVNAGTGVAVGIVLAGRLHRGASNVAGEIGHSSVDGTGEICTCGLPGCLEATVVRARNGLPVPPLRFAAYPVPPPAPEYAYLALGVVNLVNLLNPAAVVLAGGMFTNHAAAVAWFSEAVRHASLNDACDGLDHIGVADAGSMIGLIGAAALVVEGNGVVAQGDPAHA